MDTVSSGLVSTAFALAVLLPIDVWVFADARRRARQGRPVRVQIGTLEIDRPAQWIASCLVLFVFAVPLYLTARTHSSA